jgi:hypothetical protein
MEATTHQLGQDFFNLSCYLEIGSLSLKYRCMKNKMEEISPGKSLAKSRY